METNFVVNNQIEVLSLNNMKTLSVEDNGTNRIIKECLMNKNEPLIRNKIHSATYTGLEIYDESRSFYIGLLELY